MLAIQLASRSEVGGRTNNEDHLEHGELGAGWYAALADGAGGHSNGAHAARLAVHVAVQQLGQRAGRQALRPVDLVESVLGAHDRLNREQLGLRGRQRMHATLVLLWIDKVRQHALWSHAGDSRLYLLRHGRVAEITHDDSVVQRMVDAGLLDAEQARRHPQRNQLLAALGSDEAIEPHGRTPPLALRDGDAFLLCSDGWHDPLDAHDIEACLVDARTADDWLAAMQQRVQADRRPQQDNFSAIAVWVGDPAEVTRIRPT
jgi:serine/threonine protein phosphatase PrpC